MASPLRWVAAAALGLLLQLSALSEVSSAAESATPNDLARFLAGMAPSAESPLQRLTKQTAWQNYARRADASWKHLEKRQLSTIRAWTKTALPNRKPVV